MTDNRNQLWFSDSFRRNLVDMHIEDWDPVFLSQFDPYEYFENLKRAHIRSAMIYFHSHVGYCYYPTKVGKMHNALTGRENAVKTLVDLCHGEGMDVIGYYSLIYNTFEEDRHPEWRLISKVDGTSSRQRGARYGLCCPNNPGYRRFVREQIKEISEYFTVDGMFYDMTFWPGTCRCPHCQMRFLEETGISGIPTVEDWSRGSDWRRFLEKRQEWIGEFADFVTAASKEFMPHASVEHNYAYGVAGDWHEASGERISNDCDYVGGDLHSTQYHHSFAAKYYRSISKHQPFEYMISRCDMNLQCHTITKTEARLGAEVFLTAAHHGASFVIDAMDPVGTLDQRVYERIGKVFEKQIPYEKYFVGTPIEDIAVYYSPEGRYNIHGEKSQTLTNAISMVKAFVQRNVPVGVVSNCNSGKLGKYKMVFAPAIAGLTEKHRKDICQYIRDGGVFYFSGGEEPALMEELLGAKVGKYTPTMYNYFAPVESFGHLFGEFSEKYPMPVNNKLPLLESRREDAQVWAYISPAYRDENNPRHFASIHSNPPDKPSADPAMLAADYGKGKVIWSAATFENDERECYCNFIHNLLRQYVPVREQSVVSDAPHQVEICSYRTDDGYQLNFVDLLYGVEPRPIPAFEVAVKLSEEEADGIESVIVLPDGEAVEFRYESGFLKFCIPSLVMYTMIGIKIKNEKRRTQK